MPKSASRRVLVVDSDLGGRHSYMAIARSAGWKAQACEDTEAVGIVKKGGLDALILGHSSEKDLELLSQIHSEFGELPVILVTSARMDGAELRKLGVMVVVSKPPEIAELRQALADIDENAVRSSDFAIIFRFLESCSPSERAARHPRSD